MNSAGSRLDWAAGTEPNRTEPNRTEAAGQLLADKSKFGPPTNPLARLARIQNFLVTSLNKKSIRRPRVEQQQQPTLLPAPRLKPLGAPAGTLGPVPERKSNHSNVQPASGAEQGARRL